MNYLKYIMLGALFSLTASFAQVNINTATKVELMALSGLGPKKAEAIMKYRKAHGKFSSVAELTNVKGIGETIVGNLGADVKVSGKTDLTKLKNQPKKKAVSAKKKTSKSSVSKKKSTKKKATKLKDVKAKDAKSKKSKIKATKDKKKVPQKADKKTIKKVDKKASK